MINQLATPNDIKESPQSDNELFIKPIGPSAPVQLDKVLPLNIYREPHETITKEPGLKIKASLRRGNKEVRRDRKGRRIDKIEKMHHITFRDSALNTNVADINIVESYKSYNVLFEKANKKSCCLLL